MDLSIRIFFRYLFLRLLVPFGVCLCACSLLWVLADLYGNLDDFLEHKIKISKILYFYGLQVPSILVQVLPATLMFATLWTLLSLNRRCELVAFQSGGMAPIWLFSPFLAFAVILMVILAIDLYGPAPWSQVTRDRVLAQVKGQNAKSNVFLNLPYVDSLNRRVWFFQSLDIKQNKAKGVEILLRDTDGHDEKKYFAQSGEWNGEFWQLSGVLEIVFGVNGGVQDQKNYEELDLPDITTPPAQLSLVVSDAEELTVPRLSEYIATSTSSEDNLAKYRTEWWYRMLYPFSLIILMMFALLQGVRSDRRSPVGGIAWAVVVLLLYIVFMNFFMTLGKHNRMSPFVSVFAMELVFGAIGLHLLAQTNGWWWQLLETGKRWQAKWVEEAEEGEMAQEAEVPTKDVETSQGDEKPLT